MRFVLFLFQNSIRHNLSLHNKFIRVQNEGTGKFKFVYFLLLMFIADLRFSIGI